MRSGWIAQPEVFQSCLDLFWLLGESAAGATTEAAALTAGSRGRSATIGLVEFDCVSVGACFFGAGRRLLAIDRLIRCRSASATAVLSAWIFSNRLGHRRQAVLQAVFLQMQLLEPHVDPVTQDLFQFGLECGILRKRHAGRQQMGAGVELPRREGQVVLRRRRLFEADQPVPILRQLAQCLVELPPIVFASFSIKVASSG